jgi:hypothetical protein
MLDSRRLVSGTAGLSTAIDFSPAAAIGSPHRRTRFLPADQIGADAPGDRAVDAVVGAMAPQQRR